MPDDAPCTCGCPNTFSSREAEADLERYRKKGPDATTRALIDAITAEGVQGATLLDIGGGIGAIQLALLEAGAARAESVDATEAYIAVARAEATRRGYGDRTSTRVGDFVELASDIEPADIVTLDRVVCCDPDLEGLLGRATERARRMVGLVYPRDTWWNRLLAWTENAFHWLTRDAVRWHLHPVAEIDRTLRSAGFVRRDVDRTFIWQVALYVREPSATG
jgi:magnesium-protoporphyrin O-methyltransferase